MYVNSGVDTQYTIHFGSYCSKLKITVFQVVDYCLYLSIFQLSLSHNIFDTSVLQVTQPSMERYPEFKDV